MSELHHVMKAVVEELGVEAPVAPKPTLVNATFVELAAFIAELVRDQVPKNERARWNRLVELAAPIREIGQFTKPQVQELKELWKDAFVGNEWGVLVPGTSPTMGIALQAAVEAMQCHNHGSCGVASRRAAVLAATLLGPSMVPMLGAELARLDAVTALRTRKLTPPQRIVETLWRGATGVAPTHWIVRLEDETFGLLAKTRGRWTWSPGSRDDVIATVPDALMPGAVEAVLGKKASATLAAPRVIIPPVVLTELAVTEDHVLARAETEKLAWRISDGEAVPWPAKTKFPAAPKREAHDRNAKSVVVDGRTLKLDRAEVTHVVKTVDGVTVGYHQGKRAAFFDNNGTQTHLVAARNLGESIANLVPLRNGLLLAFGPWPKGTVALVDKHSVVKAVARLGTFYVNPQLRWIVAEGQGGVAFFVHNAPTGMKLAVFSS